MAPDPGDREDLGPDPFQALLGLAPALLELARRVRIAVRCRQHFAIDLSVGGQRQRGQPHVGGREHVLG